MNSNSILDSFVAIVGGLVLLLLVALAAMGTAQQAAGQILKPTATREEFTAAVLPTLTSLPMTPTESPEPSPERPPTETPRATRTPRPTLTPNPTLTARAEAREALEPERTPLPSATSSPSATPRPAPVASEHYWFVRPAPSGVNDEPDGYYPYSSTAQGSYAVHHGVEFINEQGTPVLAAGSGTVIVALNDQEMLLGPHDWSLSRDGAFYGNVVVIEHDQRYNGKKVYTLYGHLDSISTRRGARVEAGDVIGDVGMSGIALGPHLHFEVRVGANDYHATRNPRLWLVPYAGHGTIVGRVLDGNGRPVEAAPITLQRLSDGKVFRSSYSYEVDPDNPTNADDEWQENFLFGDIPEGTWTVAAKIGERTAVRTVTVEAGKTTWLWLEPVP